MGKQNGFCIVLTTNVTRVRVSKEEDGVHLAINLDGFRNYGK